MNYGTDYRIVEAENNRRLVPPEDELEEEATEKDIDDLLSDASQERYLEACKFIKDTVCNLEINYLLSCIYDAKTYEDNQKFEAELRIKLGDMRLKNYQIIDKE